MKKLLLLLFLGIQALLSASFFQERFSSAHAGDFIATEQEGTLSLLFIRSLSPPTLILEEIALPVGQLDLKKMHWQSWLDKRAPGHTSWTLYEIDLPSLKLTESFSVSKNGWLPLDAEGQLLARLLTLPLSPLPNEERRRLGPRLPDEEADHRALWTPPLIIEGKGSPKPDFDVLKALWPEDSTPLSQCTIELYFAKALPCFPFPFWIEVKSPHYALKVRTVDSGKDLCSPFPGPMPHRPSKEHTTSPKSPP